MYLRMLAQIVHQYYIIIIFFHLVWHLGAELLMKYATAGFLIYGAPGTQSSFLTIETGIPWGVLM